MMNIELIIEVLESFLIINGDDDVLEEDYKEQVQEQIDILKGSL